MFAQLATGAIARWHRTTAGASQLRRAPLSAWPRMPGAARLIHAVVTRRRRLVCGSCGAAQSRSSATHRHDCPRATVCAAAPTQQRGRQPAASRPLTSAGLARNARHTPVGVPQLCKMVAAQHIAAWLGALGAAKAGVVASTVGSSESASLILRAAGAEAGASTLGAAGAEAGASVGTSVGRSHGFM